jgi:integrase
MAKFKLADGSGEISLKHIVEDTDRHGNVRVYLRLPGRPKVRLSEKPGTDAFLAEYRCALAGDVVPVAPTRPKPSADTLSWLVDRHFESAEFKGLHTRTQYVRRLILGHVVKDDGNKPYKLLETKHVRRMRDLKADKPQAANSRVKALRAVFAWAVLPGVELADHNPAKDVPYTEAKGDGHHSWTDEEVALFEAHHPIGTKARLALALLLYSSQRKSEVVLFGPGHVHDGWLEEEKFVVPGTGIEPVTRGFSIRCSTN